MISRLALTLRSLLLILVGSGAAATGGQTQTGIELSGSVTDETGALMVGAQVEIQGGRGAVRSTHVDEQGQYRFANLPPDVYTLRIAVEGFAKFEETIDLSKPGRESFDVTLGIFIAEQVEVRADEIGVSTEPDKNLSAVVLSDADLDALPDDPDELLEVLRMMAGAAGGGDEAAIYVDGFREGQGLPAKESILRVQLNTNPFSAEFSEPGNSRIQVITRPGSDAFRGSFQFRFNDASLNARNAFAPRRPPLQIRNYSGNLSGPIIQNRWGYFLSASRREQDENEVINAIVLNPSTFDPEPFSTTVPTTARSNRLSLRTDFLVDQKNSLGVQYGYDEREQLNSGLGRGFDLPERGFDRVSDGHAIRFNLTTIVSERVVNELRFQFRGNSAESRALTDAPAIIVLEAFGAGGNQGSLFSSSTNRLVEVANNITLTRGRHAFKFGLIAGGMKQSIENRANFGGTFTFGGDLERDAQGIPVGDTDGNPVQISALELYRRTLAGVPGYRPSQFSIVRGDPFVSFSQWELGWFAQDDWRISPRLTLSYGLRHEFQTNLSNSVNLAPRFGLAWQPDQQGAGTLRFGLGIFHDYVPGGITLDTIRLDGERRRQLVIQRPEFFPEISEVLEGAIERQPTIRLKDNELRMPYSIRSTLGYERRVVGKVFVSIGYGWTRGLNLLRTRNINAPLSNGDGPTPVRPFPSSGPLLQFESTGRSNRHETWVGFRSNLGLITLHGRYTLASTRSDTDGAYQNPANPFDLAPEWGRSSRDERQRLFTGITLSLPWSIRISSLINAGSGRPFNITTGRDDNGDTIFSDRPAFASAGDPDAVVTEFGVFNPSPGPGDALIPRNFGQGPGSMNVSLNVAKTFSFGSTSRGDSRAGLADRERIDGRSGGRDRGGRARSRERSSERGGGYSLTLSARAENVFNRTNLSGFIGVLTSPFFGKANRASAPRRIELSARFRF